MKGVCMSYSDEEHENLGVEDFLKEIGKRVKKNIPKQEAEIPKEPDIPLHSRARNTLS